MAKAERPDSPNGATARSIDVGVPRSCLPISSTRVVLRPLKTSESVARDVVHDIVSRELGQGDRLPAEAQMLQTYGVSRESLREGLRLLEVQGLITLRRGPGGGPVVGTVDPANLGRSSSLFYHLAGATYEELFEAWVLADSLLVERAARHPDRQEVRDLMDPYLVPESEVDESDLDEYVSANTRFHAVVAQLADNRVLELLLSTIGQIVTHHVVIASDPREIGDRIGADHAEIAAAIRAGHTRKAREAAAEHISGIADYYRERMGPRMHEYVEWR